jgi:hypothetical protein
MPVDTSIYQNIQPVNPLGAINNAAATVNAIQQNKLTGQTLAARNSLSNILSQSTNPDGSIDYANAKVSAAGDPNAALIIPALQSENLSANAPTPYYDSAKGQVMVAPAQNMGNVLSPGSNQVSSAPPAGQGVTASSNGGFQGNPDVAGAAPTNAPEYQQQALQHLDTVRQAANGAPVANAAINNVLNLADKTDNIGTKSADFIKELAKIPGFQSSAGDSAANLQTIASHMSQIALANGMPGSDARLAELQSANLTPQMLQQTIKNMAPFLKAVNQGNIEKQNFYNSKIGKQTGNQPPNAASVFNAKQSWDQNYDPRVIEYNSLSNADKKKYVANLSDSDKVNLAQKKSWFDKNVGNSSGGQ